MARKKRDYRAEYRRRVANAKKRGLSLSQARGHPKAGEKPLRARKAKKDQRLEDALKYLRRSNHQGRAAKRAGVSTERFRRFLRSQNLATRKGRKWEITDNRSRRTLVYTNGEERELILKDFDQASINGRHRNAVGRFLETNDIDLLRPFEDQSVTDTDGNSHPLETNPNALHRLAHAGSEEYHEIYRLSV